MQSEEKNRKQNPMVIFQRLIQKDMKTDFLSLEKAAKLLKQILCMMRK